MHRFYLSRVPLLLIAAILISGCSESQKTTEKTTVNNDKPAASKAADSKTVSEVAASNQVASVNGSTSLPRVVSSNEDTPISVPQTPTETGSTERNATTNVALKRPSLPTEDDEPANAKPATLGEVKRALNLNEFQKPKDATQVSMFGAGMYYQTSEDLEKTIVSVSDELLKRGFTGGDSIRTHTAAVTVNLDGRPGTMFLASSVSGSTTHVTMYHHQGVDVSSIPLLETVGDVDRRVDQFYYTSPIGVREGQQILQMKLNELKIPIARTSSRNGVLREFSKNGVTFVCLVEESQQMEFETPGKGQSKFTLVTLMSPGNVNVSMLPAPENADSKSQPYNALFGSYKYVTTGSSNDVVKACTKKLTDAGWKSVEPIRESVSDKQSLLIWNGSLLSVQATEYENGRTHVSYNLSLLPFDLPGDVETRLIRVDTASPRMSFITTAPTQVVSDFYSSHLPELGWEPDEKKRKTSSNHVQHLYNGSHYEPLLLDIENKSPGSTWVELRPVDFAVVSSVFFPKTESPNPPTNESTIESAPSAADAIAADAIAAVQGATGEMMVPDSPENVEALINRQMEAALKNIPADQADEVRKLMENSLNSALSDAAGDREVMDDPTPSPETVSSDPEMTADDIGDRDSGSEKAEQAVPADKIAAEDFPIPDGIENVSRDFEMITFSADAVEPNAKFYTVALKELGWNTRGEQMIESDMAVLRFQKGTGTINISLILDDRKTPPVHAVIQGDGIHFVDPYAMEGEFEGDDEMDEFDSPDSDFDDHNPKEFEGIALPSGMEDLWTSGSQFRKELTTSVESDIKSLHEFFRTAGKESGWTETSQELVAGQNAKLALRNERGEMTVKLKQSGGEVDVNLAFRDPKLAKEHGFLPPTGKSRLLLANASEAEAIIVISKKEYRLEPGQGAQDPKDGIILDLKPGKYSYTIKGAGREEQSDKLTIVAGGTWGMIVFPEQGHMAEQMY